jgi:hypothetical protein
MFYIYMDSAEYSINSALIHGGRRKKVRTMTPPLRSARPARRSRRHPQAAAGNCTRRQEDDRGWASVPPAVMAALVAAIHALIKAPLPEGSRPRDTREDDDEESRTAVKRARG